MNFKFSKTALGRFRLIGIVEGFSYLFLLFIAMPVKYLAGIPELVKYTGWAHGVLFVAYMLALVVVMVAQRWSLWRTFLAFVASLIPFGTFFLDKQLYKEEQALILATEKPVYNQ